MKTTILLALATSTLLFADSSIAKDLYLRASYGLADSYTDEYRRDYGIEFKGSNAYAVVVGYQFNPYLSLEGSYSDLANYDESISDPYRSWNPFEIRNTKIKENTNLDLKSIGIGFLLSTDITRPYFAGIKAGYQNWDTEWSMSISEKGTVSDVDPEGNVYPPEQVNDYRLTSYKESGSQIYYGAIAGWKLHSWHLGLEYTLYNLKRVDSSMSALFISKAF